MSKQYSQLKDPKKFKTDSGKEFYVGEIPSYYAQRILLKAGPALGGMDMSQIPDEAINELLSYVAVDPGTGADPIVLDSVEAINMLVPNIVDLMAIEVMAIKENFGFFFDGSLRSALKPLDEMLAKSAAAENQ